MLGSWEVNVAIGKMPQKVASAFSTLNDMVGAEYNMIAYLGSQVVNGTNHAVLAEQTIITGKDVKNVVVVFFRETKEGVTVTNIERVVEGGGEFGGLKVDVQTEIPEEAQAAFDSAFEGFLGSNIKPFALLATQVTKGVNYVFAATVEPVVKNPVTEVSLITVNGMTKDIAFVDLLGSKQDVMSLGYAFTWLKREDTSAGKPAAEWS